IAVINKGRIIAEGSPQALKELVQDLSIVELELLGVSEAILDRLRAQPYVDAVTVEARDQRQLLLIHSAHGSEVVPRILAELGDAEVNRVTVREPTLEDAYVRLVTGPEGAAP